MESVRSAKRRKLDPSQLDPQKQSQEIVSSPTSHGKQQSAQSLVNGGSRGSTSSYNAWLEAKAKAKSAPGRKPQLPNGSAGGRPALDHDFARANIETSPFKKQHASASTPTKKQLDPLRNQRSGASAASSPSKGVSLDFFKQFHKPRQANGVSSPVFRSKTGTATTAADHTEDEELSGSEATGVAEVKGHDTREEKSSNAKTTNTHIELKGNWKGWSYEKPKKTFEDEIRELEDAARKQADKKDAVDVDGSTPQTRPKRVSMGSAIAGKDGSARKSLENKPAKTHSGSGKRYGEFTRHVEDAQPTEIHPADEMDMETSEIRREQTTVSSGVQARLIAAQTINPTKATPKKVEKSLTATQETTFEANQSSVIQKILLEKLTGQRPIHLTNLDEEYTKVSNLITQTVTAGESNSMLVIGARGCGKTALVNQILREQAGRHPDDFLVVRLNGFIHTDDKTALRQIWRQLGREMEVDEDEAMSKNYADTLATLLALLSHPAEQGREQADQVTKSVIFILDEFEQFASHPRQTLLYNLFDIAQSRKAPIAVLGLTTRIDVAESLEKRVKSRFSHRYVHLGMAKSFAAFEEACKAAITISMNELSTEECKRLETAISTLKPKASKQTQKVCARWNGFVEALFTHETIANHLKRIYYTTKSIPEFHSSMLVAASTLPDEQPVTGEHLLQYFTTSIAGATLSAPDSKLGMLNSLSTLQLALLICAARINTIHGSDTVPFPQVYEEYKVLASKAKLQASASGALAQGAGSRVWSKEVAKGAWENLVKVGLIMDDGSRGGRVDAGLEEIGMSGVELGSWGRWCSEI